MTNKKSGYIISSETRTKGEQKLQQVIGHEEYDYSKLRGKIKEVCETHDRFAEKLGIGRVSLSQRLNNILDFSQSEMYKTCDILSISKEDIPVYFFTLKVQKHEQNCNNER